MQPALVQSWRRIQVRMLLQAEADNDDRRSARDHDIFALAYGGELG